MRGTRGQIIRGGPMKARNKIKGETAIVEIIEMEKRSELLRRAPRMSLLGWPCKRFCQGELKKRELKK